MPSKKRKKQLPDELFVILHNIRSAHNVGAIFRTADAVGVEKVYLCGYTPIPETRGRRGGNAKIAKTALGAEKTVLWDYVPQIGKLLQELRKHNVHIIALEQTRRSHDIFSFKVKSAVALVVGNEVRGVSASVLKRCDAIVAIPMQGTKESLNVAVAVGIALYSMRMSWKL